MSQWQVSSPTVFIGFILIFAGNSRSILSIFTNSETTYVLSYCTTVVSYSAIHHSFTTARVPPRTYRNFEGWEKLGKRTRLYPPVRVSFSSTQINPLSWSLVLIVEHCSKSSDNTDKWPLCGRPVSSLLLFTPSMPDPKGSSSKWSILALPSFIMWSNIPVNIYFNECSIVDIDNFRTATHFNHSLTRKTPIILYPWTIYSRTCFFIQLTFWLYHRNPWSSF